MIINKDEFMKSKKKYLRLIQEEIFIYPTDSIYGIGCDATNEELVDKVRAMKKQRTQPFSIIAPTKDWVYKNCEVNPEAKKYVEQLGKKININGEDNTFTLVLKLKNKNAVAKNVLQGAETIGVRIPAHWFSEIIAETNTPIITTSANATGENFMTSIEDLNKKIADKAAFILYEGEKTGRPSTIIHLAESEVKVLKR